MRIWIASAVFTALTFSTAALAAPVQVAPMVLSQKAQVDFDKRYGQREAAYLNDYLQRRLGADLAKAGAVESVEAPVRIELTLLSARPNRPTFKQLGATPGLDPFRSRGVGRADLSAKFLDQRGRVLDQVNYDFEGADLRFNYELTTWGDAEHAINAFSRKVAARYGQVAASAAAGS